eukprot:m.1444930 g.1444930  ORF g.1444930 m.1444930 type:complete len:71 (-) comp25106_c0_seq29:2680-2892(-)
MQKETTKRHVPWTTTRRNEGSTVITLWISNGADTESAINRGQVDSRVQISSCLKSMYNCKHAHLDIRYQC